MGVVGGLTAFIEFINGLLASAVGRFYAFSIGKASTANDSNDALESCRQWFSLAICIHTVVPIALISVGYPAGVWVVENFLTIPPDRVPSCIWVFRFVCISCFFFMVNVPFMAMYTAKQYIAELTIYSFITTSLNAFYLYYMITHPGDWLARMALWTCILSVVPQITGVPVQRPVAFAASSVTVPITSSGRTIDGSISMEMPASLQRLSSHFIVRQSKNMLP